jgi:hypothetical protein
VARVSLVGIYLQDHLAGSVAALELIARARRENRDNELGAFLEDLEHEVARDQQTLLDAMGALGVAPSRVKNGLAWAAEKAGRLKLNGRLVRYSPLSRMLELEALAAGIAGKRSLWLALEAMNDPRLAGFELPELVERAEEQIGGVETWHRRAAAFVGGSATSRR